MNSHVIPFVSKDETVKKREGQRKTPNKGEKDRLIQATAFV